MLFCQTNFIIKPKTGECVIDIANYLIAQNNVEATGFSRRCFVCPLTASNLSEKFAKKIVGMINFRNILVHGYLRIDREIVYENLRELEDFAEFEKYLLDYIARHEKQQLTRRGGRSQRRNSFA